MKKYSLFIILIPVFVLGVWSLLNPNGEVSAWEKRAPKSAPAFTLENLFSGRYTQELEEYYADTFPVRDTFINVNTAMGGFYYFNGGAEAALVIGHKGLDRDVEAPAVSLRAEMPLGQNSGPIAAAPQADIPDAAAETSAGMAELEIPHEEPPPVELEPPDESEAENAGNIIIVGTRAMEIPYAVEKNMRRYAAAISRAAKLAEDAQVYSLVVPNAGEFYSPLSLHTGATSQKKMISDMYAMLSPDVKGIDAYDKLCRHLDEYLYFRTDHHWSQLGAYYAYTAFCQSAGIAYPELKAYESGSFAGFVGSMYGFTKNYPQSKTLKDNPDTLIYYLPLAECKGRQYAGARLEDEGFPVKAVATSVSESYSDKYICYIGGDASLTHFETDIGNGRSIIVIKDSFGNAFVPFLTSNYQDIYVVDPRYVNGKKKPDFNLSQFVTEQQINDVLFLNYPFPMNSNAWCDMLERLIGVNKTEN
ncbi:MAG: hypothetical protein LBB91_11980 [Clostridiales bacterium]|jgi:hypothetical protein|nr:hypothetical protein [Clostridiales bacterium]